MLLGSVDKHDELELITIGFCTTLVQPEITLYTMDYL